MARKAKEPTYSEGTIYSEVSQRTGAYRQKMWMGGKWMTMYGNIDDPFWDVPEQLLKVDEPIYEMLSREMIHDGWGKGDPLETFIQGIRDAAAGAPDGLPVFAKYDKESDYEGGYYYFLQVGYERSPTDEEKAQRRTVNELVAERDAERAEQAAEKERAHFERLKVKYEAAASAIEAPSGVETGNTGSTEGESAVAKPDAPVQP